MIITIFINRYYSYNQWKNFEDIPSSRKIKRKEKIFLFKLVQCTVAARHGYKLQAVSKRDKVLLKTSLEQTRQVKDLVFSCSCTVIAVSYIMCFTFALFLHRKTEEIKI